MERSAAKLKPRRKLNKDQIVEILERNVSMYRNESNFVHHMVELAVHLLEFEYDWSESGEPPAGLRGRPEDEPPQGYVTEQPGGKYISRGLVPSAVNAIRRRECPFCGHEVGENLVCTKCRNLTR